MNIKNKMIKAMTRDAKTLPNLIYTVATGHDYLKMAELLIKSIKNSGYNDKILVLSNQSVSFSDYIIVNSEPKLAKTELYKYIDVEKYNNIIFLDSDIIVTGNISEMFDYNHSSVNIDYTKIKETYMHNYCLTDQELIAHGNKLGINSGTILLKTNKNKTLQTWNEIMIDNKSKSDQAALNALNIRTNCLKIINIVEFVGRTSRQQKKESNKNARPIMKHWSGANPRSTLKEMETTLTILSS